MAGILVLTDSSILLFRNHFISTSIYRLRSFHPGSNKRAFIKGELMHYARNSSTNNSFKETGLLFWQRLRLRGYPAKFLLPIFKDISYSNGRKWFSKYHKSSQHRGVVFKTSFNCSHVGIKKVILRHLTQLQLYC